MIGYTVFSDNWVIIIAFMYSFLMALFSGYRYCWISVESYDQLDHFRCVLDVWGLRKIETLGYACQIECNDKHDVRWWSDNIIGQLSLITESDKT